MQEFSCVIQGLKSLHELDRAIEKAPEVVSKARAQVIQESAPKMQQLLAQGIAQSGLMDSRGRVFAWQELHIGSKLGYVAIRPKAKTWAEDSRGRQTGYQVGQVTNAIVSGHNFPAPSGRNAWYKPRIRLGRMKVSGHPFYEMASDGLPQLAKESGKQFLTMVREGITDAQAE